MNWIDVCALDEVPVCGAREVIVEEKKLAVFRTHDDAVFALNDRCPHRGGPLSQGMVHGRSVTCPLHSWQISLENGEALPPDTGCAKPFPVRVTGGRIEIRL